MKQPVLVCHAFFFVEMSQTNYSHIGNDTSSIVNDFNGEILG